MIKEYKVTRKGQAHPYQDGVYEYLVTSNDDATDEDMWDACQSIRKAYHRDQNASHNGACSFPYGLESFGSLYRLSDTSWRYIVTIPFCD